MQYHCEAEILFGFEGVFELEKKRVVYFCHDVAFILDYNFLLVFDNKTLVDEFKG